MTGFQWDWVFAWNIMPALLAGLWVTIQATVVGAAMAVVLGLAWSLVRLAGVPLLTPAVWFMVEFIRGTPFLIQLYIAFYMLPSYGIVMSPFMTGVLTLGFYGSCRAAELYRAGLESIPAGQWEACLALGVPIRWVWTGVVLPQIVPVVIPMLGNLVIVMFKDSALLSTITVIELVAQAKTVGLQTFRFLEPLTIAGALFWVVSYAVARGVRAVEERHAAR
jgi:polar amino acid transport system permease protein